MMLTTNWTLTRSRLRAGSRQERQSRVRILNNYRPCLSGHMYSKDAQLCPWTLKGKAARLRNVDCCPPHSSRDDYRGRVARKIRQRRLSIAYSSDTSAERLRERSRMRRIFQRNLDSIFLAAIFRFLDENELAACATAARTVQG